MIKNLWIIFSIGSIIFAVVAVVDYEYAKKEYSETEKNIERLEKATAAAESAANELRLNRMIFAASDVEGVLPLTTFQTLENSVPGRIDNKGSVEFGNEKGKRAGVFIDPGTGTTFHENVIPGRLDDRGNIVYFGDGEVRKYSPNWPSKDKLTIGTSKAKPNWIFEVDYKGVELFRISASGEIFLRGKLIGYDSELGEALKEENW